MSKIRLDKYISSQTALTRSEAVIAIYRNRVTVNGRIKKDGAIKVDTEKDEVCLDGEQLIYEEFVYYMLNKPQGVISATEDNQHKTVVELIDTSREIAPVGRLDIDTEGLLLLTDDGKLTHELLSPKKHVDKTYYAEVDGEITAEVVKGFEEGIEYGEKNPSAPGKLVVLDGADDSGFGADVAGATKPGFISDEILKNVPDNSSVPGMQKALVTISEGKFHQIKRMFNVYGLNVTYLKRISMGKLVLDESLQPGEYKKILKSDIV